MEAPGVDGVVVGVVGWCEGLVAGEVTGVDDRLLSEGAGVVVAGSATGVAGASPPPRTERRVITTASPSTTTSTSPATRRRRSTTARRGSDVDPAGPRGTIGGGLAPSRPRARGILGGGCGALALDALRGILAPVLVRDVAGPVVERVLVAPPRPRLARNPANRGDVSHAPEQC